MSLTYSPRPTIPPSSSYIQMNAPRRRLGRKAPKSAPSNPRDAIEFGRRKEPPVFETVAAETFHRGLDLLQRALTA